MKKVQSHELGTKSKQYLRCLESANLFKNVGKPLDGTFARVESWDTALASYRMVESDNVSIRASNELANQLPRPVYQQWNRVSAAAKEPVLKILEKKIAESVSMNYAPESMLELYKLNMAWDLVHKIFECEFAEYLTTSYFGEKTELYLGGYFPCGWEGDYPIGRFIVY